MAVDPTIANLDGIAFRTRLVERIADGNPTNTRTGSTL
jgi:hypothetical protein